MTPRALSERISVTAVPETVLIDLAVEDSSPARAQRIADVLGEEFIERVAELEGTGAEDPAAVRVTVAEPAGLPAAPTSPSWLPIIAMGLIGGMVAGGALALVRARLDTSVKDTEEAAALAGAPILGLVRHDDSAGRSQRPRRT